MPLEDDSAAGDRALAYRMLRNAGVAPPWIEADKEVREVLLARDALLARAPPRVRRRWLAHGARGVRAHRRGGEPSDRAGQRRGADRSPASPAAGSQIGAGAAGAGVRRLDAAGPAAVRTCTPCT